MGKKYIIELEDRPFFKNGDFLYRVKGFNSLVFDMTGIGMLTPYTEPDLERVRQKAYDKAYADAVYNCSEGCSHVEQARQKAYKEGVEDGKRLCPAPEVCNDMAYQKGLSDAWEAARTLWNTPNRKEIFGHTTFNTVLTTLTAQKTIEKIRQYEQEQEKIKVGDEVATDAGNRASVLYENPDGTQVFVFKSDGTAAWWTKSALHRTGRNFPEIATVLEKMREGSNG